MQHIYCDEERGVDMPESGSVTGIFSGHGQVKTPTYKEQAYDLIKEAVLYQKFRPDAIYSQEAICQELGISRTPVREALLELQKEGYIRFCRGKGIQIVSLDDKAIHDILEMRIYQEMTAAELAARRASQADLDHIAACLADNYRNLNDLLYNTLDDVLNHYLRFEVLTVYQSNSSANSIWEEHNTIYTAIKEHDAQKARKAAETHLQDAYRRTLGNYWNE